MRAEIKRAYSEIYKKIASLVNIDALRESDHIELKESMSIDVIYSDNALTQIMLNKGDNAIGVYIDKNRKLAESVCFDNGTATHYIFREEDRSQEKEYGAKINARLNDWLNEARQFGSRRHTPDLAPVASHTATPSP